MQKKLLYVTSRVFWPTKTGHEVHIYNYCRILKEKHGYCIDVYIIDNPATVEAARSTKPDFIRNMICGKKISKRNIVGNLLGKTLFHQDHWPLQLSLYYSRANCEEIKKINDSEHYDVLFVDMVRLAPYIKPFEQLSMLKILDMGDMLSKRYSRQISSVNKTSNVGGAYMTNMSRGLQSVLRAKWLQILILKTESKLMEKSEVLWAERYDRVLLVSNVETEEINKRLSRPKAVTVRVGVDCEYLGERMDVHKDSGTVSFVGTMRYAANSDTVKYIVEKILPLCKEVKQVRLIGKCPENISKAYQDERHVVFTGMVPDLRKEVKKTDVFLAPMAYGTGVKIKIIEAMAMGMPVVTNEIGVEGIPGVNGVHLYIGNTEQEIAAYVDELISDPEKCMELGHNAQQLIEKHFSWEAMTTAFAKAGL